MYPTPSVPSVVSALSLKQVEAIFAANNWIFARTMPKNPHWYTLRSKWDDPMLFEKVVQFIRDHGFDEQWWGKTYRYLDIGGYHYWTMGAPVSETILINRKEIALYDKIADRYDSLFSDPASLQENKEVIALLNYANGSILDIGCGTGLLLDYMKIPDYLGIDPSAKMLAVFKQKHPLAQTLQTTLENYNGATFDTVVSLFGAASYVSPKSISKTMNLANRHWFIMFYGDHYSPISYQRSGIILPHYKGNHLLLQGEKTEFKNFWIVQGWHGKA